MRGLRDLLSFFWRGSDPMPTPKLVRVLSHHPFVAYWAESAWIAGASSYNCVVQGPTLEEAVDRLARTLRSETILAMERGSLKPYYIDNAGKEPDPKFIAIKGDAEYDPDVEPNREQRYRGWIRVPSIKEMLS